MVTCSMISVMGSLGFPPQSEFRSEANSPVGCSPERGLSERLEGSPSSPQADLYAANCFSEVLV